MVVFAQQAVEQAARQGARMECSSRIGGLLRLCLRSDAIKASKIVQNPSVSILSRAGTPGSILTVEVSGTVLVYRWSNPETRNIFSVSAEANSDKKLAMKTNLLRDKKAYSTLFWTAF